MATEVTLESGHGAECAFAQRAQFSMFCGFDVSPVDAVSQVILDLVQRSTSDVEVVQKFFV